jgi:phage head maturation protease
MMEVKLVAKVEKPTTGMQQQRTVDIAVREIKDEERRVAISFSSEQVVNRWYGSEILCHDSGAVNLERINSIGVALFNHKRDVVLGRIENAVCNDTEKKTYADIIFDSDEESERIYQKVKSGTLKGISVGYSVDVWEEVAAGKVSSNGRFAGPAYIATRWTPVEISVVSVPADDTVGVGREIENNIEGEENPMAQPIVENQERQQVQPPVAQVNVEAERQAAITAERQRVSEITNLCREFELSPDKYINDGTSLENARAAVLDELKVKNKPSASGVQVVKDESDKFREAASDALVLKGGISVEKPADGARDLRGMRLRDLAIECVQRLNVPNAQRLDSDELFKRAFSPDSQFGSILSDTVNKSMATAYRSQATTYQAWTRSGSVADFKGAEVWQISEAGELEKMTQTGEFKFDEMLDTKATKKIATFGKSFGITRQALINDDLSMLTRIPEAYVRAAGRGINKLVYTTLTSTGAIYDGKALFHADHKNAGTAGAINTTTLGEGKKLMRKQKNLRGKETLNIAPRFLIVSPDKEVEAMQVLNSIADPAGANSGVANVFRNAFDLVVDAELDGNAWYLAAAANDIDTIEVSYLNGDPMPKLESQVAFDYLGMKWRIYIDYGVDVLDFRGLFKNAGN